MEQLHLPMRRAERDVGVTVCVRCFNPLAMLVVGVGPMREGTAGSAKEWGLLRGSGGHSTEFSKVRWSGECALSAGRVQAECVAAMEVLGSLSWKHRCWGCKCCEVGALLASDGASSSEPVSAPMMALCRSRMDFASSDTVLTCK
jgi:hypothetical protein